MDASWKTVYQHFPSYYIIHWSWPRHRRSSTSVSNGPFFLVISFFFYVSQCWTGLRSRQSDSEPPQKRRKSDQVSRTRRKERSWEVDGKTWTVDRDRNRDRHEWKRKTANEMMGASPNITIETTIDIDIFLSTTLISRITTNSIRFFSQIQRAIISIYNMAFYTSAPWCVAFQWLS